MSLEFDERQRQDVVRDLRSPDEDVRRLAVERVGAALQGEAIPLLTECLGDESWRVRKSAVERIVACADATQVASALIAALADGENPGRRNAAVEALVQCGSRVVPMLLEATASPDVDVRKLVVDALGGIGDSRCTAALLGLLADSDTNVRAAAADALGAVGGAGVPEALLAAASARREDPLVRFSALHALAALDLPLSAADLAPVLDDPMLRPAGMGLLGSRDDDAEAVAILLKGLGAGSRSLREAAMRALLRLLSRLDAGEADALVSRIRSEVAAAPAAVDGAIERLPDADLPTRLVLIQFLGLLRSRAAVVPILQAGTDEALAQVSLATLEAMGPLAEEATEADWARLDARARRDACVLFGRTTGALSVARLLAALEDPDPELRIAAARSLGRRRLSEALPVLVRRLEAVAQDPDFEVEDEMLALTEALISVSEPQPGEDPAITEHAVDLLRAHLEGALEPVRLAIARVLGCIGRREDVQLVAFLLKDPSADVRRAAVDALARLEPGTAAEPLRLALADECSSVRIAAAHALGMSRSDAVIDDLCRLAEDPEPRVRAAAVRSIGLRFATAADRGLREAAVAVLERALADEALVALGALEAAQEVGGEAVARVGSLLVRPEPELVKEAVVCIGRHADASALEPLLSLVAHPDWSVRAEAIQVLAERGVARAVPSILRRLETEQDDFVRDAILRALKRLES